MSAADVSPILVTGAAGFAGSHLLDLLTAEPAEPAVAAGASDPASAPEPDADADRDHSAAGPVEIVGWHHPATTAPTSTSFAGASAPGVRWQGVDLRDPAAVRDAVAAIRPAAVYHLAGAANQGGSWAHTADTLDINVMGTTHLVDALRLTGLRPRLLVISSATVYRPSDAALDEDAAIGPTSPYGLSKLAQELVVRQCLHADDPPALIVRSFNHIGPRQTPDFVAASFARQLAAIEAGRAEPTLSVGNLDARRDLMDVRDTVRAYRAIMRHGTPGRAYNVCAGRAIAIRELLEELVRLTRVKVDVRLDPARLRPADQPIVLGCHDRLTRDTGWQPEIPMTRTLADLLDYWRTQPPAASQVRS